VNQRLDPRGRVALDRVENPPPTRSIGHDRGAV
jgi:hypothetical protein